MWCDIIGYVAAVKPPLSRSMQDYCKQLGQYLLLMLHLHILNLGLLQTSAIWSLRVKETVWSY